jgi:hypothetical protein
MISLEYTLTSAQNGKNVSGYSNILHKPSKINLFAAVAPTRKHSIPESVRHPPNRAFHKQRIGIRVVPPRLNFVADPLSDGEPYP